MTRISVSGHAGSGKDTLSDILCALGGYGKDHFAFDLKRIAAAHFNWDGEKDDRGRRLLQQLGTEVGRQYAQNLWLIKFCRRHGLRPHDALPLPGHALSQDRRLSLGLYWFNHSLAGGDETYGARMGEAVSFLTSLTSLTGAVALARGLPGRLIGAAEWLRSTLGGRPSRAERANSLAKARLLALSEFGWNGLLDEGAIRLIRSIEVLATTYDARHWYRTPADYQYFAETIGRQKTEESRAGTEPGGQREKLIVPDTRFPNELRTLTDNGFFSVRVERPGVGTMTHASETALDSAAYHVVVKNDGNLDTLRRKALLLQDMIDTGRLALAVARGETTVI